MKTIYDLLSLDDARVLVGDTMLVREGNHFVVLYRKPGTRETTRESFDNERDAVFAVLKTQGIEYDT